MAASPTPASPLSAPVSVLYGVGRERAVLLERLGIRAVGDLLLHRPNRHEDRRHFVQVRDLQRGQNALVHGTIVACGVSTFRKSGKSVFTLVVEDATARVHCRWWNMPYLERYFARGQDVLVYGRVKDLRPATMEHPETEVLEGGEEASVHMERIVPVYPLTEGVAQRWLRALVWRTLQQHGENIPEPHPEVSPAGLPTRAKAIRILHFPEELAEVETARRRLALDEFLDLQIQLQTRRRNLEHNAAALPCRGTNQHIRPFLSHLGFTLTEAQTQVLREIRQDLGGPHPMRRLLQGDVGSGKTVVAACAALMALESGFQVALMAPTQILAEQHWRTFQRWFSPLSIATELITSELKSGAAPDPGAPRLIVGTHALIQNTVNLTRLGLVIIDEQHKFGVTQRERLVKKGSYPHLLVMTATPIPRTLGLTLYGDLDSSVIHQMPPGRGRIRTFIRTRAQLDKVHEFIRQKLAEGRQAYVVCPRVEESDSVAGIKAVMDEQESLRAAFAPFEVGLLHGRLTAEQKETVMAGFRANRLAVLLATSIVEVGVDVPNATVMLVENAEQFGLAQLHQLRGRIGRGAHNSFCILLAGKLTAPARDRLRVLEESHDGFRIAEADLALRGPGELLGQDQSGTPRFRFGDLAADLPLIEQARELAKRCVIDRPASLNKTPPNRFK